MYKILRPTKVGTSSLALYFIDNQQSGNRALVLISFTGTSHFCIYRRDKVVIS